MGSALITRKDIANSAVTSQPRKFDRISGKSSAARVFFSFSAANVAESMPHALGKTPSGFRVVSLTRAGAPGVVYAPSQGDGSKTNSTSSEVYCYGRNYIVLACTTANTFAEVEVF